MAINFPNSPAVNDTFTVGGINFTFTGVKWESGAVVELSSDTTPTLGGNLDGGAKNINNVGVITATGFSGSLTGNVTGNATGLTGNPSIQVTNATVLGNLDVQGTTSTIDTAITQVDSLSVEGSVGIGTDNPGTKLDVRGGNWSNGDIVVGELGNAGKVAFRRGADGSDAAYIGYDGASNNSQVALAVNSADGTILFKTNSEERLRITSDGKIGIGTDNPTYALSISGTGPVRNEIVCTNNDSAGAGVYFRTMNGGSLVSNATLRTSNNGNFQIFTGTSSDAERLRIDSSGNSTFTGTVSDSKGDLRKIIFKQESSAYTLVAADAGKAIEIASGGITVPTGVFGSGDAITIINDSGSSQSITMGAGLGNMFNVATGTSGNLTLAGRGMSTIYFVNNTTCYISGGGLS